MTGPEHYVEGERLLAEVQRIGTDLLANAAQRGRPDALLASAAVVEATVSMARAHFAAAQVAATVDAAAHPGQSQVDYLGSWQRVVS